MSNKQRAYLTAEAVEAARQNPGSYVRLGEGRYMAKGNLPRLLAQASELGEEFEITWMYAATHQHTHPVTGRVRTTHLGQPHLSWSEKSAAA